MVFGWPPLNYYGNMATYNSYPGSWCFTEIMGGDYRGAIDITNSEVKKLNPGFPESTLENAIATAYLLDSGSWTYDSRSGLGDTSKMEYVIGGPTIYQLCRAYNKKYRTDYNVKYDSWGYTVANSSNAQSNEYKPAMTDAFKADDTAFVWAKEKNLSIWVSSPSNGYMDYIGEYVMTVQPNGSIGCSRYDGIWCHFRRVVCLKSSVSLEENGDGNYVIK